MTLNPLVSDLKPARLPHADQSNLPPACTHSRTPDSQCRLISNAPSAIERLPPGCGVGTLGVLGSDQSRAFRGRASMGLDAVTQRLRQGV